MPSRPLCGAILALTAALTPALASAATAPLYERAFMLSADMRCSLFTSQVRAALSASKLQARSAVLRAGADASAVELRARYRAAATPCRSADLRVAAARVRAAHAGWARMPRMTFPGEEASWRADRMRSETVRWRVVQSTPAAAFGLAGVQTASASPYATARLPRRASPALARLTVGRRTFLAETRSLAPESLALPGRGRTWGFRFPPAAAAAMAVLPPNERAELRVLAADRGQTVLARMPIDVGDFAAAQAFLAQGPI